MILKQGILGKTTQRIGNLTTYNLNGQNIARTIPISVANPNTVNQQRARNRQTQLVDLFRYTAQAVNQGFANRPQVQSRYNAFVAQNNPECFTDLSDITAVVAEDLIYSTGSLTGVQLITDAGAGDFRVDWNTSNIVTSDNSSDELIVCAVGIDASGFVTVQEQEFEFITTAATRGASGTYIGSVNASLFTNSDAVRIFAFFASAGRERSSNSISEQIAKS